MKKNNVLLILSLFLLYTSNLRAQLNLEARVEIPNPVSNSQDIEIISLQEKGLIMIQVLNPYIYENPKPHLVTIYNKDLQKIKARALKIPFEYASVGFSYFDEDKFLYFFYQNTETFDVKIIRYNIYNDSNQEFDLELPMRLLVDDFRAVGEQAFLIGKIGLKTAIMNLRFSDESSRVLPNFYNKNEVLLSVQPDLINNEVHFNTVEKSLRGCDYKIKTYANQVGTISERAVQNRNGLVSRKGLLLGKDQNTLIGLYSKNCIKNAEGIYVANFEANRQKSIRYKPFVELVNFFNVYGDEKAEKLKEKYDKKPNKTKKINGNQKFKLAEKFYEHKDQSILLIEAYHESSASSSSTQDNRNRPQADVPNTPIPNPQGSDFQIHRTRSHGSRGFGLNVPVNQFNYGILCAFDKNGRLLWDNAMDIKGVEREELKDVLQVGYYGDSVILAYQDREKFYSKMIHRNRVIQKTMEQKVEDILPPVPTSTIWGDFIHWHDNIYLFYGEQQIKQNAKRFVHLTKLSFVPQPEKDLEE